MSADLDPTVMRLEARIDELEQSAAVDTRGPHELFADQRQLTELESVLLEVGHERLRQERKCAEKLAEGFNWYTCASDRIADGDKLAVLTEEVGEVAKECCDMRAEGVTPEARLRLRTELIQVAAVATSWAESL